MQYNLKLNLGEDTDGEGWITLYSGVLNDSLNDTLSFKHPKTVGSDMRHPNTSSQAQKWDFHPIRCPF